MRIWSLHPKYLDRLGLLACWRETLLAQNVLMGATLGYQHHPQLIRFRACPEPLNAIATYLFFLADEADSRGYVFDRLKIRCERIPARIPVAQGQILFEWNHLKAKLSRRDPDWIARISGIDPPESHPLFYVIPGVVESWEKG